MVKLTGLVTNVSTYQRANGTQGRNVDFSGVSVSLHESMPLPVIGSEATLTVYPRSDSKGRQFLVAVPGQPTGPR